MKRRVREGRGEVHMEGRGRGQIHRAKKQSTTSKKLKKLVCN